MLQPVAPIIFGRDMNLYVNCNALQPPRHLYPSR